MLQIFRPKKILADYKTISHKKSNCFQYKTCLKSFVLKEELKLYVTAIHKGSKIFQLNNFSLFSLQLLWKRRWKPCTKEWKILNVTNAQNPLVNPAIYKDMWRPSTKESNILNATNVPNHLGKKRVKDTYDNNSR